MDKQTLHQTLHPLASSALEHFKALLHRLALFHGLFLGLIVFELFLIAFFFSFLVQSAFLAISVALLVLTVFCYFVLRLWVQTKKRQDAERLADAFQESISRLSGDDERSFDHYSLLTRALHTLASIIKKDPEDLLASYAFAAPLRPLVNYLYHKLIREERLLIQELILDRTIQLWIEFIRQQPTHLEAHAGLGTTYITYSTLYSGQKKHQERFKNLVQKAAEEFKILSSYAPNDIWVHHQLANTYHDLALRKEEIRAYEAILALEPQDAETLLKLGRLYFEEGRAAEALSLYEELKKFSPQKSEQLIAFYT